MGLDMYVHLKRSVYLKKGDTSIDINQTAKSDFNDYESDEFGCSNRVGFTTNECYWRKANAIHRWFVNNVQDGKDECQESYVPIEKTKELLDVCGGIIDKIDGKEFFLSDKEIEMNKKDKIKTTERFVFNKKNLKKYVLGKDCIWDYQFDNTKNKKLIDHCIDVLPTCDGFFFGTTKYDGGYFYDVIKTYLMLTRLLKKIKAFEKKKCNYGIYYQASW